MFIMSWCRWCRIGWIVGYDAALLTQVFKHGKDGMFGRMPAYSDMTEEDIAAMAEYLDKNR